MSDAAAFNLKLSARNERDSFRVSLMFFDEDARTERVRRVRVKRRDNSLYDDWPTVQCLVNEVNRAAGKFNSMLDGLTLRIESGECRKQARMNVEYPISEGFYEAGREQSHEACKADEINRTRLELSDYLSLVLLARAPAPFNRNRFDPTLSGALQARRILVVANADSDFHVWKTTVINRIRERQHVRPAT